MRPSLLLSTIPMTIALAAPTFAQPADAGVLVEAERAFARDVAEMGMRDGFLTHLADDAIVFQMRPVAAVPAYEAREPGPAVLEWEPAYAEITAAGDLGWTTGPWVYRAERGAEIAAGGHYVSIWRRGKDGTRRVELDVGAAHAIPAFPPTGEAASRTLAEGSGSDALASLEAAERAFAEAAAGGIEAAYASLGAEDLRVYRMGREPAVGRETAVAAAAAFGPLEWSVERARVSADGALGYAYGTASPPGGETAGYLRIWRQVAEVGWELALDLATVPPRDGS